MDDEHAPDARALHHALIDDLVEKTLIASDPVEAAFRAVRREFFVPDHPPEEVYDNRVIPTKVDDSQRVISSSSQPAIMAIMLEQLDLQPGHNVLEIGAGTGYNAALMAHIVGEQGRVTTVDIDDDLVQSARTHLAAAGFERVQVVCDDGMYGFAQNAPYDRIILTVAGWDVPPEWLAQLKPDGRLLMPLSFYGPQLSIAFERRQGRLFSRSVKTCGFMPVRGPRSEPSHEIEIGEGPQVTLMPISEVSGQQTDPAVLEAWLRGPSVEQPTGMELSAGELLFRWPLRVVLQEPQYVFLRAHADAAAGELVSDLLPPWRAGSMGILAGSGLALLAAPADAIPPESDRPFAEPFPLYIHSYGPDETVARRLLRHLQEWDGAGRPGNEGMSVWAVPAEGSPDSSAADAVVTRRWHHFCLRWEAAD